MKKSSHCEGLGTSDGWCGVWLEQKDRGQNGWITTTTVAGRTLSPMPRGLDLLYKVSRAHWRFLRRKMI